MGDCSLTEPSGRLSSFQGRVEALGYIKLKKDGFPSSLLYLQIHYQFWSTVQHIMKRAQGRSSNFRESGPCGLSDTGWKVPWFNWPQLLTRVQRQCFKGLRHNVKRMLSWQMKTKNPEYDFSVIAIDERLGWLESPQQALNANCRLKLTCEQRSIIVLSIIYGEVGSELMHIVLQQKCWSQGYAFTMSLDVTWTTTGTKLHS